jgi:hypothetical protein
MNDLIDAGVDWESRCGPSKVQKIAIACSQAVWCFFLVWRSHLEGEEFKPEKSGIRSNIAVKRHN